jgi:hypothetical protein
MSFLDYFRTAFELAKKAQSVELQSELLSMREDYNALQEKNIELQARVKELEAAQALAADLTYREQVYYLKKPDGSEVGPYCQRCWDIDHRLVRVVGHSQFGSPICVQCEIETARARKG